MDCAIETDKLESGELSDYVANYLLREHEDQLLTILDDENTSTSRHHSVSINCLDLLQHNVVLGTILLHKPLEYQSIYDEGVQKAQEQLLERKKEEDPTNYALQYMTVKASCHLRLHSLPRCPELCKPTVTSIRAEDINRLLSVSGTVIRTAPVKMIHQRRDYVCAKCNHQFNVECDFEMRNEMKIPAECPSQDSAKACGGTKFDVLPGSETCRDYQEVRIQEQVHKLTVGSIPRSITLVLHDDLVDRCKPGDDVTVVGVLRKRWRPLQRDQRPDIELALTAEHVRVRNEERGADRVSKELANEFESYWQRHKANPLAARDFLLRMTCPSLAGMYLVKLATLLTILGGVSHTDRSGMKVRGESHMLLVGDAGTGKSQVLRYAAKLSPRSVLTTGIGSTAAGLTCTAVKDSSGEWMLEAGALVLADGGVCCVDEFDSIKNDERTAVLEAMEQQTISVAKAGMVCKLRTKCTVVAATNPKGGKLDRGSALHSQTGLATPLISRFDVVLLLSDHQDPNRDKRLSSHILASTGGGAASQQKRESLGANPGSAAAAAVASEEPWQLEKLRSYLEYVKVKMQPTLSEPAQKVLSGYYSMQRNSAERDAARSTIRMLEALVRLAQAHARLMFRPECTVMDAVFAVVLMEGSYNSSRLLDHNFSVLRAEFVDDPDEQYKMLEQMVLNGLGVDLGPDDGGACGACDEQQPPHSSANKRPREEEEQPFIDFNVGAPPPARQERRRHLEGLCEHVGL